MPLINNRPPVVSGPIIANMLEDSVVAHLSATLNAVDPDLIDFVRATGIPAALPEGITYDTLFHQFVIDAFHPAFQSLAAGQVTQIIVTYIITDGFAEVPQSLIVNLTGMNDVATIGGTTAAALSEDGVTSATGTLTVVDVDNGEAAFQPVDALLGTYGSLWLAADGQWTYILDNNAAAVQALTTGQQVVETFAVHSVDGTEQILTFTVTGANETLLFGTGGNDVLTGTAADEMLLGLAGRDLVSGNDGADTLDGGLGADSLHGGNGDDVISLDGNDRVQSGGAGSDTLVVDRSATVNLGAADQTSGDKGTASGFENVDATFAMSAVTLTGSAAANILAGGSANDRLTGGLGADLLYGNGGADRFVLRSAAESRGANLDEIADFTHGTDRIDLSAIDAISGGPDTRFSFVGGAAFTQAGQLRYDAASGLIEGDINGDQVADFAVVIGAGLTITAADFIL